MSCPPACHPSSVSSILAGHHGDMSQQQTGWRQADSCRWHAWWRLQLLYRHRRIIPDTTRTTRTPAFWDTPRCPMITHQIPSQNNTESKLQILKNCQNFKLTLHATHLLKMLYKIYKYEMDPTRTVEATEQTRDAGQTRDGRTDGRTEWNQYTPPTTSLCGGYNYIVEYN